jgi:hypothetical protein
MRWDLVVIAVLAPICVVVLVWKLGQALWLVRQSVRENIDAARNPQAIATPHDFDPAARAHLIERISRHGDINDPETLRPMVTLEEFFEGNGDWGSIGCNLPDPCSPAEFHALFRSIRDRDDVHDVRVEIQDVPDETSWPFTDTVWVVTSATAAEVESWFEERVRPDEVLDGMASHHPAAEPLDVPAGMRPVGVWWD